MIKHADSTELLGEVISWDMLGNEVSLHIIQDALTDAGLDPDAAKELTTQGAFSRACKHLKENRTIDKIKSDHGVLSFQFTKKHLEGEQLEFSRECTVKVDIDTGAITCDERPELATEAKRLLDYAMQTRSTQDITRLVQTLFKNHADLYSINRRGIAYFVPEAHREFTAKVDKFLGAVGGKLSRFPVPKGTAEGNASVRDAVSQGLSQMLKELNSSVEEWDDTTRESTMGKVQERYEAISLKVDAYSEYLLGAHEGLKEKLDAAKKRMVDRICKLHEEDQPAEGAENAESKEESNELAEATV